MEMGEQEQYHNIQGNRGEDLEWCVFTFEKVGRWVLEYANMMLWLHGERRKTTVQSVAEAEGQLLLCLNYRLDLQIDGRRYCLFATCYSEDEECKAQRHCSMKVK